MSRPVPSRDELFAELKEVLVGEFGFQAALLRRDTHLVDDLDLDSIDFVDMAVALEVRLGRKLEEKDLQSIRTLGDVADVIHARLQAEPT